MKAYPRKQIMTKTQKFAEGGVVVNRDRTRYGGAQINPGGLSSEEIWNLSKKHQERGADAWMKGDREGESSNIKKATGLARASGHAKAREWMKQKRITDPETYQKWDD